MSDKRNTDEITPVSQVGIRVNDEEAKEKYENNATNVSSDNNADDKPYSVFTHNEKRIIVLCAGLSQFFSPISGQIYFPSLNAIAADLHVSNSLVNLTITTYLIMQGLAPAFVGGFSDSSGRRPTYFICFIIYAAANIGLGVQNNYTALMVLRCLQSAGGSGTVALAQAVVSDIVTSQERGAYVSYMSIASQAGPSLGPLIGGLLGQYLGWHSIFWFLLISISVVFVPAALFLAETCRNVVDDGSVPPPKWRRCYINSKVEKRIIAEGRRIPFDKRDQLARKRKLRFPNPLDTVKIVFTKEAGYILVYIGMVCCGYYATVALIPSQFGTVYGFNQIQIALCYLPLGCGSLLAGLIRGRIIDSRYKAHAKRLNFPLKYNRQVDLSNFPIERARLEVVVPTLALGSACFIGFGWMIQYKVNLAGPLVFLFVIGFCVSASINTVSVLLVDIYPGKAGTATAANNLVRCWLGAGATSGVEPLIKKVGIGWTTTFFGLLIFVFSPILWYIMKNGPKWRRATKERKERQEAKREAKIHGDSGDRQP
ncbi:MFS multidrug transporter-like protein [Lindgomyces ingoldianus]|uniref:MFS multidrug transporter-like protein n=1 Tax=Lindgomyces ingoldianus TaxID=673940 RepID=A0ACB6R0F1_9PLEO|nr:MFS multidrug transporter-like protein [Lindgomyces ingoldianus]KAF2472723.1 MFS multidrug transporter-like protein [Lindgomyces ingoldianus]